MIYLTTPPSQARAGHRAKDTLSAILIARYFGFRYFPSGADRFVLDFLNLKKFACPPPRGLRTRILRGSSWEGLSDADLLHKFADTKADLSAGKSYIIVLEPPTRLQLFKLPTLFSDFRETWQTAFHAHANKLYFSAGQKSVAVHIRRGDLAIPEHSRLGRICHWHPTLHGLALELSQKARGHFPDHQHYCFPTSFYKSIVTDLKRRYGAERLNIHIYTESENSADVVQAFGRKYTVHRNGIESLEEDFYHMVQADILVTSSSSLSQVAGYLSRGTKIYSSNDHYKDLPAPEFIACDLKGNLQTESTGAPNPYHQQTAYA